MEARPSQIIEFFNGTKQMLVPLFQRPYEWGLKEWETLWEDLLEQYERTEQDEGTNHFTGAIVTAPAKSIPTGVSKFLVIDGQQRLTTVAILICSLRSLFEPETGKYRKLTRLLVNEDDEGYDHYKLLPTQPDRDAFRALVGNEPIPETRFADAFTFFRKKIQTVDSDGDAIDLERLSEAVQNRLTVVAIHLGDADDPYLIFESLNAKGTPLTQADLIRNYLLLRLKANDQQRAYERSWLPMQALLTGENLTEFMRQFLMMTGEEVAKSAIYAVLKKRLLSVSEAKIGEELARMQRASMIYAQIIGLARSTNSSIAAALDRLRRWEVTTANPLVLRLMENAEQKITTDEDVLECLLLIESFAVRRAVCRVPTNQMKRIFLSLTKDLPQSGVASWMSKTLSEGTSGRRWPKDEEFRDALLSYRAYAAPVDRCKFLLERLEQHVGHRELATFETATIEHIMPQSLTDDWRLMLGEDHISVHEQLVDVLGNLTLTAYNSELSNSAFSRKRTLLAESHYELNRWIAARVKWTGAEIRERTEALFKHASEVWHRPVEHSG